MYQCLTYITSYLSVYGITASELIIAEQRLVHSNPNSLLRYYPSEASSKQQRPIIFREYSQIELCKILLLPSSFLLKDFESTSGPQFWHSRDYLIHLQDATCLAAQNQKSRWSFFLAPPNHRFTLQQETSSFIFSLRILTFRTSFDLVPPLCRSYRFQQLPKASFHSSAVQCFWTEPDSIHPVQSEECLSIHFVFSYT